MNALELAQALQDAASTFYGKTCGLLWDGGAMISKLHAENEANERNLGILSDELSKCEKHAKDLQTECAALRVNEENLTAQVEILRAQLAAQGPDVRIPLDVLEEASAALGNFCADLGWSDTDMQAMDNLDAFIARHKAILSAAPSQQAPTNCRHCGGPDSVLCAGQCKAKQPAKDIGVEQDERVFARVAAMKAKQQAPAAQGEPVAWKHDCAALLQNDVELWVARCPHCGKPKDTHPQQASEPMTDEQIEAESPASSDKAVWFRHGIRVADRHHQIKGKQ
jgi:hypothetical protein